ncbi:hypothetical protein QA612_20155 [Evansella sp. AB-P1]|uniref:hypothetical protein n=1 Tax=Evansella sp. AB-P1 TaxID=3037653 RepID=UPI00241CA8E6|nr:hypothetical protein [Evansella sp. AB-P1]MDG5789776.1 hypothetical protein [Evansella sp. AB-P1]
MIEELIEYYKKNLSNYSLVFKYFKRKFCVFWIVFSIFIGSVIVFLLSFSFQTKIFLPSLYFMLTLLVINIYLIIVINQNAKNVLLKKYGIVSSNLLWSNNDFYKLKTKLLKSYLEGNDLYSEKKLNLIINLCNREYAKNKVSPFIPPGVFLALFLPIWIKLIDILFSRSTVIEEAINFAIIGFILIIIFAMSLEKIKNLYNDLKEEIFNSRRQRLTNIIIHLEELLIQYPNNKE